MSKFEIGDKVRMTGVPVTVEVLEIGKCNDVDGCPLGDETFRFYDPDGHGDAWEHTADFEKV